MDQENKKIEVDLEVLDLVLQSKIPVQVKLDGEDVAFDKEIPFQFFTFFFRVHYPSLYFKKIHNFFKRFAPVPLDEHDIWLEYNNKAIPWNIPFGVTFDLLYNQGNDAKINFFPLELTLHYRRPYKLNYVPLRQNECIVKQTEQNYRYNLKEALLIKFPIRGAKSIQTEQTEEEWNIMWNAFIIADYANFLKQFNENVWISKGEDEKTTLLPLRIYIENYEGRIQQAVTIQHAKETLGDYLSHEFPQIISKTEQFYEIKADYNKLKVYSHGIECDLNMPLLYLYKNFYYCDGFVYIVIKF